MLVLLLVLTLYVPCGAWDDHHGTLASLQRPLKAAYYVAVVITSNKVLTKCLHVANFDNNGVPTPIPIHEIDVRVYTEFSVDYKVESILLHEECKQIKQNSTVPFPAVVRNLALVTTETAMDLILKNYFHFPTKFLDQDLEQVLDDMEEDSAPGGAWYCQVNSNKSMQADAIGGLAITRSECDTYFHEFPESDHLKMYTVFTSLGISQKPRCIRLSTNTCPIQRSNGAFFAPIIIRDSIWGLALLCLKNTLLYNSFDMDFHFIYKNGIEKEEIS